MGKIYEERGDVLADVEVGPPNFSLKTFSLRAPNNCRKG